MLARPGLSAYLRRFRPSAAPGSAAPAGVPADFAAGLEAELAPLFAALEDARIAAEQVRVEARHEADARRAAVTEQTQQILAASRREAAARRSEAASQEARRQSRAREDLLGAAAAEADRVRARARARLPGLVATAVQSVRVGVGGDPGAPVPRAEGEP